MQLLIDPLGQVSCLYTEAIPLASLGSLSIRRASRVEPDVDGWYADLSPCHGPKLGPFSMRSEALLAEEHWLEQHLEMMVLFVVAAGREPVVDREMVSVSFP